MASCLKQIPVCQAMMLLQFDAPSTPSTMLGEGSAIWSEKGDSAVLALRSGLVRPHLPREADPLSGLEVQSASSAIARRDPCTQTHGRECEAPVTVSDGRCKCPTADDRTWEGESGGGLSHEGRMQACKLTFSSYRLQPLGSYPRIVDKKGSHDLFGPVNRLYCTAYDKAMVLYLACLKVISHS